MMPAFHGERMRAYGKLIVALARAHTDRFVVGDSFSVVRIATSISLDTILQAVFGERERGAMEKLGKTMLDVVDGLSPLVALFPALRRELFGLGPWAKFQQRMRVMHQALDQRIADARANPERDDVLSVLVHTKDESGEHMTDDEVRDQLLTLLLAGHETTAISIAWIIYALHRDENASILAKLREELAAAGDPADAPDKIAALPYLDAVCMETMRRYPLAPAPAPRKLKTGLSLGKYEVPPGFAVAPGIGMVHFNPAVYADPMRFSPERFHERRYSPFEHIPFGGGARRCLGAALAVYEMKLAVATMLLRFTFALRSQAPDRGKVRAANVAPKSGVPVVVTGLAR
jgi:cytochrome P450